MTGTRLGNAVWNALCEALELYRDDPRVVGQLRSQLDRLEGPLRIAVAGPWQAGKSTLVNAVLGEEVAPLGVPDGQLVFTWYQDGPHPRATAYAATVAPQELPVARSGSGLRIDLVGWRPGGGDDIVVQWPTRALRQMTLIDTPALTGTGDEQAMVVGRLRQDADAILYLTRDARDSDLRILESLGHGTWAQACSVNVILVLCRADEVNGGRIDALVTARQLARRHCRDPLLNALSVHVVPVSGQVGLAGRMLGEADFAALAALAQVPHAELAQSLLSVDRFSGSDLPVRLDTGTRRRLLELLGLFGVRLAITLIRAGHDSRVKLSAELIRRSGLIDLREAITRSFVSRAHVLKAGAALSALEQLLRTEHRPAAMRLLGRVEQIVTGAHDFRELRLLAELQDSRVRFDAELAQDACRLIGGNGVSLTDRLGAEPHAPTAHLWQLASDALRRWQQQAEAPWLNLAQRRAARVVARSCEGLLAELAG